MLENQTYLITGISDANSLAMYTAKEIIKEGGNVVCAGLGVTPYHKNLSEKAEAFLQKNYDDFSQAVKIELGEQVEHFALDVSIDESMQELAQNLAQKNICLNGFLHAIAMDKTIRKKQVKPLVEVTQQEFAETMNVSAFSLARLSYYLLKYNVLQPNSSVVSLSYVAADRVTFHPYKNISIAKAALERITIELSEELGRKYNIRYNTLRFSPYMGSKAGAATLENKDFETSNRISPLGNALPLDLAQECVHLFRPNGRITGEIRHIDGGYNKIG